MRVGEQTLDRIYVGTQEIDRVYLGNNMVYEEAPTILTFTTVGSTFSPFVELHAGSTTTVEWYDENGSLLATGTTPTINFGTEATRVITMTVQDPEEVRIVNLGFDNGIDFGKDSLPSMYNKAPEAVIAVDGIQYLSGLIGFMATHCPLGGHLDLSNCRSVEYVEVYATDITSIDISGCDSMIRLVVELSQITELDLNPVAATLRDLRAAAMQGGSLTLAPLTSPMASLWHFCVRRQSVINIPHYTNLPVIEQFWAWFTGLNSNTGTPGVVRLDSNVNLNSVQLSQGGEGPINTFHTLDLSNNTWGGGGPDIYAFNLDSLHTVNLSGCTGSISTIRLSGSSVSNLDLGGIQSNDLQLQGNALATAAVDSILATVDGWGTSGGSLNLLGNGSPTIEDGQPRITSLLAKGWTVQTETPISDPLLWEDDFERADGPLTSPWQAAVGGGSAAISSGQLTYSGGTSYQRLWAMPSEIVTANHEIIVEFEGTPSTYTFFGVLFHMNSDGTGCKALLTDAGGGSIRLDGTAGAATGTTFSTNPRPESWSNAGVHTFTVRVNGQTVDILLDNVLCYTRTNSVFSNASGNGVGLSGQLPGRIWNRITVNAL